MARLGHAELWQRPAGAGRTHGTWGKRRAIAKGIRRPASKLRGHLELFTRAKLLLARGRTLDVITGAETAEPFHGLRDEDPGALERIGIAYCLVELLDQFTEEEQENRALWDLLTASLRALSDGVEPTIVARHYELRLLGYLGYQPNLDECMGCGESLRPGENWYSADQGGVLCPECRHLDPTAEPISVNALKLLRLLAREDAATVAKIRISGALASEVKILHALVRRLYAGGAPDRGAGDMPAAGKTAVVLGSLMEREILSSVRDALRDDHTIFRRATGSASRRADGLVASLRIQVAGAELGAPIEIVVGDVQEDAKAVDGRTPATQIRLTWKAARSPQIFPSMDAVLSIYPLSPEETQLDLYGRYTVPLGPVGDAFDSIVGHRIANLRLAAGLLQVDLGLMQAVFQRVRIGIVRMVDFRRENGFRLQIDDVLGLVGQVGRAVFHLGDAGVGIVGTGPLDELS